MSTSSPACSTIPKAAAHIALETVDRWLLDHPGQCGRVIISAFAEVDVDAFTQALHEGIP